MRSLPLALIAVSTLGCAGTIYVDKPQSGPYRQMPVPVLPEASVNGPIVEHVRVTGWSTFSAASSAVAVAGNRYAGAASSVSSASRSFEYYQSADVQSFLEKLLEDTGTVTRIFGDASWEIKGWGGDVNITCGGCLVYSVVAQLTLLAFVGVPLVGERDSLVELRVYHQHDFIRSYTGEGQCTMVGTWYWILFKGYSRDVNGYNGFDGCAAAAAVADAVRKMQDDPPVQSEVP
jgi:hypothetical protein